MRFYPCFVSVVILAGVVLLVPIPAITGQAPEPGVKTVAPEDFPEAPSSRYPVVTIATEDGSDAGQKPDNAGTKGSQHQERRPASGLDPSTANISGTVLDVNGGVVPGAVIVLEGATASDRQTAVAGETGAFQFGGLTPAVSYHLTVAAKGFENWKSPVVILNPGQYLILQNVKLKLPRSVSSVTVYSTTEQIATQQVTVEEHQRVLGVFPNFYVTYESEPAPLTTQLKFRLAYKADSDVVTFAGVAFMATIYQAGDIPNYGQGWDAYGKRVAAGYADTTTDIFIGGAILPWLLHQDPRYFYQGTGTTKSRFRHAMFSPFVCRGDNGKPQPNYSSLGGDLTSGAISNLYYPESNRGAGLVFQGFLVTTGVRMANGLIQEFLLRKLTPTSRHQN